MFWLRIGLQRYALFWNAGKTKKAATFHFPVFYFQIICIFAADFILKIVGITTRFKVGL